MNGFGRALNASLGKVLLGERRNGGFIDSCNHHCGSWTSDLTVVRPAAACLWGNNPWSCTVPTCAPMAFLGALYRSRIIEPRP